MNSGYIKIWRKSIENGWLQNSKLWAFWCYCLIRASHKEITVTIGLQRVELKPGQFIFGRIRASKDLKINTSSIYRIVKFLVSNGNITVKSNNKFSIITVMNWGIYQGDKTSNEHQANIKRTSSEHKQECKALKNKDKKIKKEKPEWLDLDLFDEFKKMRLKIKRPMTEYAEERAISKIKSLMDEGYKQSDIINQSIDSNWKSFYPVKYKKDDIAYRKDPFQDDLFLRQAYDLIGNDKEFNNHCEAFSRCPSETLKEIKKIKEV